MQEGGLSGPAFLQHPAKGLASRYRPAAAKRQTDINQKQNKMKKAMALLSFPVLFCGSLAAQLEPASVPFQCDFNTRSTLEENWTILDANNDGITWGFYNGVDADGNAEGGYVGVDFADIASDDYLISRPLSLEAGTYHIGFYIKSSSRNFPERIAVMYGNSSEVDGMTVLQEIDFARTDYSFHVSNVTITEAGNYYFAFHACSDADMMGMYLDNVFVRSGRYDGEPDLAIESLIIPEIGCDLSSEERIGVRVRNQGTADISQITMSYQISNGPVVEETFRANLSIGNSRTFLFTQAADLSASNQTFQVSIQTRIVEEVGVQPEADLSNNDTSLSLKNFSPIDLPEGGFVSDFRTGEGDLADWSAPGEGWEYEGTYYQALMSTNGTPLVSRCINLSSERQYQLSLIYLAGADVEVFVLYDDFDVLCGPYGSDMADWETIMSFRGVYTEGAYNNPIETFNVPEDGTYNIAIVPRNGTCMGSLYVQNLSLSDAGPAGLEEETEAQGIRLYPNPVDGLLNITAENGSIHKVRIYNMAGALVCQSADLNGEAHWQYNVSNLAAGTYVAEITTLQGQETVRKFVVR